MKNSQTKSNLSLLTFKRSFNLKIQTWILKNNFLKSSFLLLLFTINCSTFETQNYNRNIADLAYSGDIYSITTEISRGRFIDERDSFQKKYTALMVASREGDYRLAEWLIERGANINAKTPDGHTALMYASYNRYPEIVKLLLSRGAKVNLKTTQGHTALSEVLESDKKAIIEMLQNAGAVEEK
jgi:uncharacterized protein